MATRTPVIVGVGDFINRSLQPEDSIEPLDLIVKALFNAFEDAAGSNGAGFAEALQQSVDSVDVIASWTWPYHDLPALVAEKLGLGKIKRKATSGLGGNQPAKHLDEAARRISKGECNVAVVCGGEALASLAKCAAAGKLPPPGWTNVDMNVSAVPSPTTRELGGDLGGIHSIGAPIQVYPLYENAFRAARGQTMEQNHEESGHLYAEFAKVAAQNPMAWSFGKPPATEQDICTVSKKNRMICLPYPLLMNAFNNINLAGACVITSVEFASKLGLPQDKWIYPLGGAGTRDAYSFWERPNFYSSPAISKSLDGALEISNLSKDQIDIFDLYSCFPIVPKLACAHLGLTLTGGSRPITLLGGLTSFGGAGNNYSMHSIIEVVRHLRRGHGKTGLVLANGGSVTYQHVICLSKTPRADKSPYPAQNPLPDNLESEPHPPTDVGAEGEVEIETYTVEFDRDGHPSAAYVVGRLISNGHRVLANEANEETLKELGNAAEEQIGKRGWVIVDPSTEGRGLFTFQKSNSKL